MALAALPAILDAGLRRLEHEYRAFANSKPVLTSSADFTLLDECVLEGLLSRSWQCWCVFCRDALFESCKGGVTSGGVTITPNPLALSDAHISGAAIRAKNHRNDGVYWGSTNSILRLEPTWGDVDRLVDIVSRLGPNNQATLAAAFSSASPSAKVLQTIRNAAAHHNPETMNAVSALSSSYVAYPVTHPAQALFWTERSSGDFLVTFAIADLTSWAVNALA
jgi:hypothetical protein